MKNNVVRVDHLAVQVLADDIYYLPIMQNVINRRTLGLAVNPKHHLKYVENFFPNFSLSIETQG